MIVFMEDKLHNLGKEIDNTGDVLRSMLLCPNYSIPTIELLYLGSFSRGDLLGNTLW
jgi:hypothetical protein